MKLILYHGTSEKNAKQIEKEGFVSGKKYNWKVKSKKGFVYLSTAYAPFFAMASDKKCDGLALIKVEVESKDCYPEDDFLMCIAKQQKFPNYTQEEFKRINLEDYKKLWKASLEYMGNVAVRPDKIKILGVKYFNGEKLLWKCDPVICPLNFKIMGDYYKELTEWIFDGKDYMKFKGFGLNG
jgi:hypothetical protein